jgi:hypothetical protein
MKTLLISIVVLSGLVLAGCDSYVARSIGIVSSKISPTEADATLLTDFGTAVEVIETFVALEGFDEIVSERETLRRVYQKNAGRTAFRLTISGYPQHNGITVAMFQMQTRTPSAELEKMYAALYSRLRVVFGERVRE